MATLLSVSSSAKSALRFEAAPKRLIGRLRPLSMALALLGISLLPACTVNYYGTHPDTGYAAERYRNRPPRPGREPRMDTPSAPQPAGPTSGSTPGPASPGPVAGTVRPPVRPPRTVPTPVGSTPTGTHTPTPAGPTAQTGGYKPIPGPTGTPGIKVLPPAQTTAEETPAPATTPAPETGGTKSPVKPGRISTKPDGVASETVVETGGIKSPITKNPVAIQPETAASAPGNGPKKGTDLFQDQTPDAGVQKSPVLVFAKTRCLGNCPTFTAMFWEDGRVTYTGQENVPKVGTFQLQLPADVVRAILREAEQMGFARLQAQYTSNTSDLPSTILTIHQPDGSLKTVRAEDDVPGELQALIAHIDAELAKVVGGGPAAH